jgi:hypothetical protein
MKKPKELTRKWVEQNEPENLYAYELAKACHDNIIEFYNKNKKEKTYPNTYYYME